MAKKPVKKAKKAAAQPAEKSVELVINKNTISKVESNETPAAEALAAESPKPVEVESPKPVAAEKLNIDLDKEPIKGAIAQGLDLIKGGKTKADAARAIYGVINAEPKEVIVAAFIAGATLTEKGALTYWYNCKRKAGKAAATTS